MWFFVYNDGDREVADVGPRLDQHVVMAVRFGLVHDEPRELPRREGNGRLVVTRRARRRVLLQVHPQRRREKRLGPQGADDQSTRTSPRGRDFAVKRLTLTQAEVGSDGDFRVAVGPVEMSDRRRVMRMANFVASSLTIIPVGETRVAEQKPMR